MNWLVFALLTIFFYAWFDFFVKLSSDKIHAGLGGFLINLLSTIVLLFFLLISKFKGENIFQVKSSGILYSIVAGVFIGFATISLIKMFATGVNLSVGIPFARIGMVLLASLLGILILKETISLRYFVGFILSLVGLYLLITK